MLNNTNKLQLDRIAQYIGTMFGVVNSGGVVEYYSAPGTSLEDANFMIARISEMVLCIKADLYSASFFVKDDILFHEVILDEDNNVFFFLRLDGGLDEGNGRRLLGMATYALECSRQQNVRNVMSMFKKLIIDGKHSVDEKQIMEAYSEYASDAESYMVLLISKYTESSRYETDDSDVCAVLKSVFPADQGFVVLSVDNINNAIICPISKENTYEDMLQYANTIHDTMISEAMTDVYVAAGSPVANIMDISTSYHDAEAAIHIGLTFGINQKCFVYSNLSLEKLIYSIPKDAARMYINELFGESFLMDKSAKELLDTVHVFLMNNLNVSEASRALYIHRNTLMYRLDKFNKMTNLDCTKFATGMQVDIALRVLQYLSN